MDSLAKPKRPVPVTTLCLLISALTVSIVCAPERSIDAVAASLALCAKTVVPSLFPFFVCCNLLTRAGLVDAAGRLLSPVMRPLFRVSGAGAVAFCMGIVGGYPVGAKMVTELYQSGAITQTEARRLLPFCNNSGPLFVLGAVGVSLLGSRRLGVLLYGIHVASALAVGVAFRFYRRKEPIERRDAAVASLPDRSLGEMIASSVADGVRSILSVCGFIVFSASVLACLTHTFRLVVALVVPLTGWNGELIRGVVSGVFELTNGASLTAAAPVPLPVKLAALSFLLGFGGVSVHLQTLGVVAPSGLGMKTYLVGKTCQGVLSAALTAAVCRVWPSAVAATSCLAPSVRLATRPLPTLAFALAVQLVAVASLALVYFASERRARHRRSENRRATRARKYF